MTKEQAIALHDSGFWREMTLEDRARFQLHEPRLCMPFDVFHEAVEKTLGRPVFTHEFADSEALADAERRGRLAQGIEESTLDPESYRHDREIAPRGPKSRRPDRENRVGKSHEKTKGRGDKKGAVHQAVLGSAGERRPQT